ncbi:hypothetical protein [Chengkuizengella marina]|uniref:Uncharacterized protein n=1 Tax=Chengkuizengella marina TaxID=2507566 RepID=A0A6N9Q0J2_9BACL|nr:hypothetical protein [Chengkuizengella marina]NBI27484.1 hypothetical protein [Chengkuizengella marina]
MSKSEIYKRELSKLNEIFEDVEESKRKLVEGLIEDAAFLRSENHVLKQIITQTGMVKVHPEHPELQKPTESAKQYSKSVKDYCVVIKTLSGVLMRNTAEDDEEYNKILEEMRKNA